MIVSKMQELFTKHDHEFVEFKRIKNALHPSRDFNGMFLLSSLNKDHKSSKEKLISWAESDVIGFNVDVDTIAKNITEEQIITLIRCGVLFDIDEETEFRMVV